MITLNVSVNVKKNWWRFFTDVGQIQVLRSGDEADCLWKCRQLVPWMRSTIRKYKEWRKFPWILRWCTFLCFLNSYSALWGLYNRGYHTQKEDRQTKRTPVLFRRCHTANTFFMGFRFAASHLPKCKTSLWLPPCFASPLFSLCSLSFPSLNLTNSRETELLVVQMRPRPWLWLP